MRIEKLARWALVTVGLSTGITACDIDRAKYEKQCLADEDLKLYHKNISISFSNKYDSASLNTIQLYHIHDGRISELFYSRDRGLLKLENIDLSTRDTLIVRMIDPAREFILHDFKNGAKWGGKKFLGCYLSVFKINGIPSSVTGWRNFDIPSDSKS